MHQKCILLFALLELKPGDNASVWNVLTAPSIRLSIPVAAGCALECTSLIQHLVIMYTVRSIEIHSQKVLLSFEQLLVMLVLRSDHSHPIEARLGIIAENTLKPVKSSEAIQLQWFSELHVKTVVS